MKCGQRVRGGRQEYDRTVELHGKGICCALLQFKDVRIDGVVKQEDSTRSGRVRNNREWRTCIINIRSAALRDVSSYTSKPFAGGS